MRELLEEAGAEVPYLSPCSPDLNPIEQAFAKLKHLSRLVRIESWPATRSARVERTSVRPTSIGDTIRLDVAKSGRDHRFAVGAAGRFRRPASRSRRRRPQSASRSSMLPSAVAMKPGMSFTHFSCTSSS